MHCGICPIAYQMSADPSGNVRRLQEGAAPQKRLEKAWGFEDLELHIRNLPVLDPHIHRAFTFNACEIIDLDRPDSHRSFSCRSLSARNARASELKFLNARTTSPRTVPSRTNQSARDSVFGFSLGPKQP